MPKINQHMDYSDPEGQKIELIIEIPPTDWCNKVIMTVGANDVVQLNKSEDGTWHLVNSLDNVKQVPKRQVRQSVKRLNQ